MRIRLLILSLLLVLLSRPAGADLAGERAQVHVLRDVQIVPSPGSTPMRGSIVVRDGRIDLLGEDVEVPPDARVHDLAGRWVYAGWVEPYLRWELDSGSDGEEDAREGVVHPNTRVRPETRVLDHLPLAQKESEALREAGYTSAAVFPASGVFRGTGAIVSLSGGEAGKQVIRPEFGHAFAYEHGSWPNRKYPNSLMGGIALARQTLYDATWYREAWAAWEKEPARFERPEESRSLSALQPVLAGEDRLFAESEDIRMLPRILRLADEFGVKINVVGGGSDEYKRLNEVQQWLENASASLIVTLKWPEAPQWKNEEEAIAVELDDLLHWERAPANLARLEQQGVAFAVTSQGLSKRSDVLDRLRSAVRHGLSERAALAALTTEPARLLDLSDRVGVLQPGYSANLVVATGPIFDAGTQVEEVWIDGERHGPDVRQLDLKNAAGSWLLSWTEGRTEASLTVQLTRKAGGTLSGTVTSRNGSSDDLDANVEEIALRRGLLSFRVEGDGAGQFSLRRSGDFLRGSVVTSGRQFDVSGRKAPPAAQDLPTLLSRDAPAWPPVYSPSGAPSAIHVKNATIWTCGPNGTLEQADLVVADGSIRAVGVGLRTPKNALVVDGTGRHVTPGLIDCHSHSSISGGVNEGTNSCTAEVSIGHVVNPTSRAIYRELAGGLTVSNLLHGSANTIGGQNAVIKLKWGRPAEELLFAGAPSGIKFALGENVKQSNWGDDFVTRYPQTRMGVEQFLRERFHAAEDYRHRWSEWRSNKKGAAPRRDLQLDALLEILDGDRLVHCHSYRSDEIIMLMRVAEDFGFRIGTFQHVLEGYKCANELAAHGAGASSFSDWWSYKYEVIDAIPYNGEIMWRRGVNVSFNSDSSELSRRMNLEATKAVKYGRVPDDEALKFVTMNPAMQLGIDEFVGSLEVGKHADFVIWSADPLSDFAVCEETWIEGVRYFSRSDDLSKRRAALDLRERLLAKAREAWPTATTREKAATEPPLGRAFGASLEEEGLACGQGVCHVVEGGHAE